MSTYVSPTAPTISATGISAPNFAQILTYFTQQYLAILGADTYLGNDSQDYQMMVVYAQANADANNAVVAAYNSFSPTTAQGVGLSSNVKINGLTRLVPTNSVCLVTLTGNAGQVITNGTVIDTANNIWDLPASVTIGGGGTVTVLATCATAGAIAAGAITLTTIGTPQYGWSSVTNGINTATPGDPVETDPALRLRQGNSVALPSVTIFEGIVAALENLAGVTRVTGYENNTGSTNGLGIPANTLYFLVEGGTESQIQQTIFQKITPGIPTKGSISVVITDSNDSQRTINYDVPLEGLITAVLAINPLSGWSTATEPFIQAAVVAYINALPIGQNVSFIGVLIAASLAGTPYYGTFSLEVSSTLKLNSGAAASTDVTIAYNQAPYTNTGAISFNVL